jgi:fibronectin type 3 domain-containing protein
LLQNPVCLGLSRFRFKKQGDYGLKNHRVTVTHTLRCALWLSLLGWQLASAQSGPVGHWKLDEGSGTTTADASGSGSTGTLVASPTWSTGRINSALTFSGARYVTAGAPSNLANLYTSGMTVSAWIKPASAGTGNGGRIIDKSNGGAGWSLKMNGATKVQFSASEFVTTDALRDSGTTIVLNTWQHVAVTWTGSPTATNIHLYVNGILSDGTATNGAGALRDDTATPLAIGNRPVDAARGFDGLIDDARIYNRILTTTEIQALADSTVPSAPSSPSATPASSSQINLTWTASTDNVAVTNYLIERCTGASCTTFVQVGTATGLTYNDTGLTASTTYRYRIRATDANTNMSAYSNIVDATTTVSGADVTPPTAPTNLSATPAGSQINLGWAASTDNVAVTAYLVERCHGSGCSNFLEIGSSVNTTYADTNTTAGVTYRYQVRARDATNNRSPYSNIASATQASPPTTPTGLTAIAVSAIEIDLGWTASSGGAGVTGYLVERCQGTGCANFAQVGTPSTTTFYDAGRTAVTSYSYRVRAVDSLGITSNYSSVFTTQTLATSTCD